MLTPFTGFFTFAIVTSAFVFGYWLATREGKKAVRRTENRIFEQTSISLMLVSRDGRFLMGNPAWRRLTQINSETYSQYQKSYNVLLDPYLRAVALSGEMEMAFREGRDTQSKPFLWNPTLDPAAPRIWIVLGFRPLVEAKGVAKQVLCRFIDVTAEQEAGAEAKRRAQVLSEVVNNSTAVVFAKDLDGRYLMVNDQWQNALGIKREHVIGRTDYEIFPKDVADQFTMTDRSVMDTKHSTKCEEVAPHGDGLHTYYSVKFPIRDASGTIQALGGIATDITDLKRSEAERAALEVREKTALEASVMKSIFLANMSHELRTPINGVMGMADLLRSTSLSDDQHNMTDHILHSAESLLTLVNDILDLSKAEAGKIEIEQVNLDLERMTADIEKTLKFTAEKKGLHLSFAIDKSLPRMLRGDPTRVRQVLMNLVSNALKFTEEGGVGVRAFPARPRDGKPMIRFQVNDTGIGLSNEALPKLFMSFSQADASTTRKFGGSGLGLSISKHLVNLMGGDIGVTRRPEGGTQFWFELPLIAAESVPVYIAEYCEVPSTTSRFKILVAEDNATNQIIAARMLQKLGHEIQIASNGREALMALETNSFDLILMDCQMPEIDGYEAARTIRTGVTSAPAKIPIIALTANAMRGDREKCLEAGMTDYVSKPVRVVDIEKAIARVMSEKPDAA